MLAGGASMVYHFMSDDDVQRIMKHPRVGFASDASVLTYGEGAPHPRGYGNNARVLGEYVRTRKVIALEEAIRKMTSLPADHFRFTGRGRLAPGKAADIVVFDPGDGGRRRDIREAARLCPGHPARPRQRRVRRPRRRPDEREARGSARLEPAGGAIAQSSTTAK